MMKLSSTFLLTAAAMAVSSAFAAEKEAIPDTIPQVLVTAQKRAQTEMEVPQSMTVVSGATLEKLEASTFSDYLKLVPGLQLVQSTPGAGRLVMRGIDTGGIASTVAVYLDETPFGSSSGLVNGAVLAGDFDTFDMQRVEVLRGPQGALYGASSLGGLLKFVTNAPETDRFVFRARAGVAKIEGGGIANSASVVVNAPISDTVAFRASGSWHKNPGFVDSIGTGGSDVAENINKSKNYGARASLLIAPNKDFSVRLSALAQNIRAEASGTVESDPNTLAPLYGRQSLSQFVPSFRNVDYRVYNATVNWSMGFANLTSSTSLSHQNQPVRTDATFLSPLIKQVFGPANELYLGQETNLKKLTQEVRLSSNQVGQFEWLVGAFFTDEDGLINQRYVGVTPGTLTPIATLPNLADVHLPSKYKEVAGFGNVTTHLGERFDLDLGARYSRNKQDAFQTSSGALVGVTNNVANSSENVFTYSVAPKMKLSPNSSLYARVAKGYRPGGPNVLPPNAPANTPKTYQSDSVLSSEVGLKARTADGLLSVDVAAFHIRWTDIQLLAAVNGFGVNTNGVAATSDGLEFTATVRPMRGLSVSANGTINDAKLDGDTSPLVGGMKGDKLPFSPKFTTSINSEYRWMVGDTTAAFAGASLRHVGEQKAGFDATYRAANGHQRQVGAYSVIDMHAGVDLGRWTVEVYGKNLGNSDGKTSTSALKASGFNINPNGAMGVGIITPRTVGLTVAMEY